MRPRGSASIASFLLLACGARERDPRPNVLLISLDSVRADFVGAYGAKLPHASGRSPTPNLDRLAAEGVLYENALSTTSWTLPAHVSLLTGEPELVHAVEQDGESIPADLPTLAETLRERGYRTYGVYSGPYLDPRYGFARGFERYEAGYGPELAQAVDEVAVSEKLVGAAEGARDPERARVAVQRRSAAEGALELASHRDVSSQLVTDLVLAELARAAEDERPFFVFAHYFDPHYDYVPPPPFSQAFDPDYAGTLAAPDFFSNAAIAELDPESPTGRRRVVDERGLEHVRALYAGEIAWTDSRIGLLLELLELHGLAANTLVVVVGDHGDEFFEHGSIGHRQTLCEEVVRVPWIMRLPGRLAAGERRKDWMALSRAHEEILALVDPTSPAPVPGTNDALGRLVRTELVNRKWQEGSVLELELPGEDGFVQGMLVSILETFRHGSIKLARRRSFAHALGPDSADMLEHYYGDRLADDEHLRWIDLEAHPDEPEDAWSQYFDEPLAWEALNAYRSAHAALLRQRRTPQLVEESTELLAALRGLGYVGQEARLGVLASEELVLPPPGERMLGPSGGR